jgi:hypothetical protein
MGEIGEDYCDGDPYGEEAEWIVNSQLMRS